MTTYGKSSPSLESRIWGRAIGFAPQPRSCVVLRHVMNITQLGEPRFPSPRNHPVNDEARIPQHIIQDPETPTAEQAFFEIAGPRARLFFDPKTTRAGIVTCDGLCLGLNNVIRSLFLELRHGYGVKDVLGFRRGLNNLTMNSPTPTPSSSLKA